MCYQVRTINQNSQLVVSQVEIVLTASNQVITNKTGSMICKYQIKVDIPKIKTTTKEK